MWGLIFACLLLIYPLFEIAEDWRRRHTDRRALSEMRKHVDQRHHWDVTRGQWIA